VRRAKTLMACHERGTCNRWGGKGEIGETSTLQRVHAAFVLTDGMINDPDR